MRTLKQFIFILAIFLRGIAFSQTNGINVLHEKYNTLLEKQNKGMSLLVKKEGEVKTLSLGSYNLTSKSVFNIGSATKTYTSILILQEMEKGNLKLSDSIGKFLPPIKNVNSGLTIEALLTHETGLAEVAGRNIIDIFFAKDDSVFNKSLLDQIGEGNPEEVGNFNYCNTNYLLLGKILEKITDKDYFDLLEERIFEPLKLDNTYAYLHQNIANLALPTFKNKDVSEYINHRFFKEIAGAAGSIASTLEDMEVFYTTLFETEKLLKEESLQLMLNSGSDQYGLGIFKLKFDNTMYYGHGGNNIGYAFDNGYNPKTKELFMMFSNAISIPVRSIEGDVLAYLNNQEITEFKTVNIDNFKDYAGKYFLKEANLTLEIAVEEDKIFLVAESQGARSELNQKDENTLIESVTGVSLTKIEDDLNSLSFHQNGFTTTIKRITP